jgi:hypothetical protein
MISFPEKDF